MFSSWLLKAKMMKAYVSGDLRAAIEYAKKSLAKNEKDVGVLWTIAECSKLEGDIEEAVFYGEKSYSIDPKHFDTLQLLSELYFYREDYSLAYDYVCRAILVAEEIDVALQPYIDIIKHNLSSSKVISVPANAVQRTIDGEQNNLRNWIAWALQFKAWYENNNQ